MILKLDDKGRCPECQRKPLRYKRQGFYACRCMRHFDLETGVQIDSYGWKDGERVPWP